MLIAIMICMVPLAFSSTRLDVKQLLKGTREQIHELESQLEKADLHGQIRQRRAAARERGEQEGKDEIKQEIQELHREKAERLERELQHQIYTLTSAMDAGSVVMAPDTVEGYKQLLQELQSNKMEIRCKLDEINGNTRNVRKDEKYRRLKRDNEILFYGIIRCLIVILSMFICMVNIWCESTSLRAIQPFDDIHCDLNDGRKNLDLMNDLP